MRPVILRNEGSVVAIRKVRILRRLRMTCTSYRTRNLRDALYFSGGFRARGRAAAGGQSVLVAGRFPSSVGSGPGWSIAASRSPGQVENRLQVLGRDQLVGMDAAERA